MRVLHPAVQPQYSCRERYLLYEGTSALTGSGVWVGFGFGLGFRVRGLGFDGKRGG